MLHTRKNIDCVKLKSLYLKDGLSLIKIGKILGFSSRTIEIKAKECKIPLRKPGNIPPKILNQALNNLYLQKRMSSRKIAKMYKCSYSYIDSRIKLLNIPRRNLSAAHITTKRNDFSGNKREKAYLIGFRTGDLRVRKMYKNSETILVDCGSTKPNQITLIKSLFQGYGRVWMSKPKNNKKIQIECSLNNSFAFLIKRYHRFPKWALQKKDFAYSIVAGFIDAEGSFYISRRQNTAAFSVGNYDKDILVQIKDWLNDLNFNSRLFKGVRKGYTGKDGYAHTEDYWILSIVKKIDLSKFTKEILPFLKHKDRIRCAQKVLMNINRRNAKYGFLGMQNAKLHT